MTPDYTLKYDPIPNIFEKGNSYHHLKALSFLMERDDSRLLDVLKSVKSSQNADGGWGYYNNAPSHIDQTVRWFEILLKYGVKIK